MTALSTENIMKMSTEARVKLIEKMAEKLTDSVDMDCLIQFFYDAQYEHFDEMTDEDLLVAADELELFEQI
jgi:hypothetical protein